MEWFEQQESRLTLFLHSSGVVSEGGLEPPWSFAPQGPQPCASTKFRHSDLMWQMGCQRQDRCR